MSDNDTTTITKADIVEHLCLHFTAASRKEVKQIVDQFFTEMGAALLQGDPVKLSRFGTLSIKERKAHKGRDFQRDEEIMVAAKRGVHFHASAKLIAKLNGQ